MSYKDIAKISLDMQGLAIAKDNLDFANKKHKNFVKQGTKNLVGTSFLKANAELLGEL